MSKNKRINKFDALVDKLYQAFIKIPNFDLAKSNEASTRIFNSLLYRIAEVHSYRELVCKHFIPATNRLIFESKKDYSNSKYKNYLIGNDVNFQETLYDTVRTSYVSLFHKLENYINVVIKVPDLIFNEVFEDKGTVDQWAKDKFKFNIKDWQQFHITHKINWISNCVKHKDGLPIKEPKPRGFENVDITQRIRIKPEEFKSDCDELIKFYSIYLDTMIVFAQHKLLSEMKLSDEHQKKYPKEHEDYVARYINVEELLLKYVESLKLLK